MGLSPIRRLSAFADLRCLPFGKLRILPVWNCTNPQSYVVFTFGSLIDRRRRHAHGTSLQTRKKAGRRYAAHALHTASEKACLEQVIVLTELNYSMISATTPEPTVLPPSRIAKRRPFSIAMGVISSTVMSTLSPGRHISTSAGREMVPVTSVVLK